MLLKLRKLKKLEFNLKEHLKDRDIFEYYSESKCESTKISNMHIQHIINAIKKVDDGRRSALIDIVDITLRNEVKYREMISRDTLKEKIKENAV